MYIKSVNYAKSFFVTTPIFYVNASPHIGHLYSAVIADAIQRWQKIIEPERKILFCTGTDEHGMKIQQAAVQNNMQPSIYCDYVSASYKELFSQCKIDYTDFIRTSSVSHVSAVQYFWKQLKKSNHIYLSDYEGWYCTSDETFLTESQLMEKQLPNGEKVKVSIESGHPVEWTHERNYMFRLNLFQSRLYDWLIKNENIVKPKKFHRILLDWISASELPDISISRPASRVHWAIPVPTDYTNNSRDSQRSVTTSTRYSTTTDGDDVDDDGGVAAVQNEQTVYVWLDALVNYLTVAGYPNIAGDKFKNTWPPDVQVVGKDILKFHGIYWPAFLMAADLELPRCLLCHSHWTVDGEKMSKSKGNVISPANRFDLYTAEGLRYFLIREGVPHSDGNYSDTKAIRILNSELADTFGNLLSRCCGKALNPRYVFPACNHEALDILLRQTDVTKELLDSVESLPDIVREHYTNFNFYKGIDTIIATLHLTNLFFETMKPWELKKHAHTQNQLDTCINITLETLRICSILLQPVLPILTEKLLNKLNIPLNKRNCIYLKPYSWQQQQHEEQMTNNKINEYKLSYDHNSNNNNVLFKRIIVTKTSSAQKQKKNI